MNKIVLSQLEITKKLGYALLILSVFFIFFIDYFFVIRFQVKTVSSLGQKTSLFSKDIKETHANFAKMGSLNAEAAMLQEKLGKAEKSILPTADMNTIADYILELAAKYEVQVNQVSPLGESEAKAFMNPQGEYLGLPISVEAEGGYHNIGLFFSNIENGETCMNIQSFQISQNQKSAKRHLLKMIITVFVLKS
jgi:Tfp pilus assembly protein PilO